MASSVFAIVVLMLILAVFSLALANKRQTTPTARLSRRQRPARMETLTQAAQAAMRRAGYQADSHYVQVVDIGLLAYREMDEPKLVRYGDVLLDTEFLRPFVELWLPHQASGTVRFELLDSDHRLRYADETRYQLQRGKNTLLPGTWLPLRDKVTRPGDWQLRVLAGETLLAVHPFGWQAVGGGEIQRFVETDGELSPTLQQALQAKSRQAVSLADLLAGQEEG